MGSQEGGWLAWYLLWPKARRHPGVLLQRTARVVVRCGAPLAREGEFAHLGLHLQRQDHRVPRRLLSHGTSNNGCWGQQRKNEREAPEGMLLPSQSFFFGGGAHPQHADVPIKPAPQLSLEPQQQPRSAPPSAPAEPPGTPPSKSFHWCSLPHSRAQRKGPSY